MGFSCRTAVFGIGCALILGGCVSSGTYQLKEQESRMLSKSLEESRSSYAELQNKFNQLQGEKTGLESELKKQKADLGDSAEKNQKLTDSNGKLTADLADARGENDRLRVTNDELSDKLKKLAVEFVEIKNERDKVTLANLTLSGKISRLSSEMAEMKATNDRLTTAVRPENILKTVGEYFDSLQQKLDGLGAENARLKLTILEMRGSGRVKGSASTSPRAMEENPAVTASEAEKSPAAARPTTARPAMERQRSVPPATFFISDEESIVLPQSGVK